MRKIILFILTILLVNNTACLKQEQVACPIPDKILGTWTCIGIGDKQTNNFEEIGSHKIYITFTCQELRGTNSYNITEDSIFVVSMDNSGTLPADYPASLYYKIINDNDKFKYSVNDNQQLLLYYSKQKYLLYNRKKSKQ